MVHCTIELGENYEAVYYPGDLIKGTVEWYLNEPRKFRGIYIVVHGAATCHWTEPKTGESDQGGNRETANSEFIFDGKEVYLNTKTYFFGDEGAAPVELAMGKHRYDFACQLPPQLPASFEASHGSIRYNIKAVLDVPWNDNIEFNLQFTILSNDDLNLQPQLKVPCQSEEIRRFCCLFCETDPLIMTVTIPCCGYTPGQKIHISIMYNNKSNVEIAATKISFIRSIRYTSQTLHPKTKTETENMVEVYVNEGVYASSSKKIEKDLKIPEIMICSNSQCCKVVEVSYELHVEGETPGCHDSIVVILPITIGSIPFSLDSIPIFEASAPPEMSMNELVETSSTPALQLIPDSPPPSFDEAVRTTNYQNDKQYGISSILHVEH